MDRGFWGLPRELRDMIYRQLVLAPDPIPLRLLGYCDGMPVVYEGMQAYKPLPLDARLLRTSKQVHAEAAKVLYSENTFRVRDATVPDVNYSRRQAQGRRIDRAYTLEHLVLYVFCNSFDLLDNTIEYIRRIQLVSKCDAECECTGSCVGGGGPWKISHIVELLQAYFRGLRMIELEAQFVGHAFRPPDAGAVVRHMRMMAEVALSIRWNAYVQISWGPTSYTSASVREPLPATSLRE
ncbi:uncharacterized protein PG986_002661 [Apiospora aurea]|uniref:Uncharacterized protein n=1 Tax=Apiospora aurea TaxID=335848 RepID=A0ABR1QPG5_9PEZI